MVLAAASKKLHQRRWKTVVSLAVTLERRSPRHSAAPHHMSGSGVGSAGLELWRRPEGLCLRRGGGVGVGSAAGSLTSSSCSFNQDTFLLTD